MLERLWNRILLGPDDGMPDLGGFEADDGDMTEFIELGPGEEPPIIDEGELDDEPVTLTKAELAELKRKKSEEGDSSMLVGLINGLKEAIQPGQARVPEQQVGETDEEFNKRIAEELFDRENGGNALQSAIERYAGKEKAQLMQLLSEQNRQLLELNPKTSKMFEKYGEEIEKKVKELPPGQQLHPNAWKWALDQVKLAHADDIQGESVDALVAQKVAAELKKYGIEPEEDGEVLLEGQAPKRKPVGVGSRSGRGSANVRSGRSSGGKKPVYYTAEDARIAKERMVPLSVYLRSIGKA